MLTPEQLENRKNSIGGSDVFAIMGKSSFKTPHDVYLEKIGEAEYQEPTEQMNWGNWLEAGIIKGYESKTGNKVETLDTVVDEEYPFLHANVDGYIRDKNIILEVKNSARSDQWGEPGTNEIPLQYLCQVAHYCAILKAKECHIAVLIAGQKLNIYKYQRNSKLEDAIRAKCVNFWQNHVQKRVAPPLASSVELIKVKYNKAQDTTLTATDENVNLCQQLLEAKKSKKTIDKRVKDLETELKLALGDNARLADNDGHTLATWQNVSSRRLDSTKLSKDRPDIYDQYVKTIESRRLNIKEVA